jgi:hypothetical protein
MPDDAPTIISDATEIPDEDSAVDGASEPSSAEEETIDAVPAGPGSPDEETVDAVAAGPGSPDEETVDAVPVLAQARPIEAPVPAALPAAQAVAVAATGFVAGAATIALVKRHSARKVARRSASRRAVDLLPIVGTRTFLVDVHLIAKPQE